MYVVVQAQEGDDAEGYGAVTGMKRLEQIRNDRNGPKFGSRTAAIISSLLAAVALVALATMNNNADAPVAEESTFTGSMQKYNPITGLLVTKYADPGFYMRVWWGTPVAWDDLKGPWSSAKALLGESKMQTYITSINFPRASTLAALIGPPVPKPGTSDFQTLVCVWKGRFEVVNGGLYNLTLRSSAAGATLSISGETVIVNDDGDSETATDVKLGSGFHEIQVLWKAPGADRPNDRANIALQYSGPDTDGHAVFLSGVHFPFEMDEAVKKASKKMVKKGFGAIEYAVKDPYLPFQDTRSGLPSLTDLMNESLVAPLVGARLKKVDMANHAEFVAKLKDRKFPKERALMLVKGLVKIETAGTYNFTLESDDGAQLYIDNDPVADTRLDELGELPHNYSDSGAVYLQHGWHLARIVWFQNSTDNDAGYERRTYPTGEVAKAAADPERQRDSQVLRLLYTGPDTGGDPKVIPGYHLKGVAVTGSLSGIQMSDGGEDDSDNDKKERNWAADFDREWLSANKDKPWKKYDDADHKIEIDDPADKIVSPYVNYDEGAAEHRHAEVPDEVYDHKAPYDHEAIDIGGKGIVWKHKEADGGYLKTVLGKSVDWSDNWEKTPKSASDPSR